MDRLSWATASCQRWEDGHYTAHRDLAAEEVDVVLFLGDYIYERPIESSVRSPVDELGDGLADEATTLEGYRLRYALYKCDTDLQAAHHAAPWMVTCDDHEVENDYADRNRARARSPASLGVAGRLPGVWEHQPVRGGPPRRPSLRLHRRATYGDLATFHLLDTAPAPLAGTARCECDDARDRSGTMAGSGPRSISDTLEHRRPTGARRHARPVRRRTASC